MEVGGACLDRSFPRSFADRLCERRWQRQTAGAVTLLTAWLMLWYALDVLSIVRLQRPPASIFAIAGVAVALSACMLVGLFSKVMTQRGRDDILYEVLGKWEAADEVREARRRTRELKYGVDGGGKVKAIPKPKTAAHHPQKSLDSRVAAGLAFNLDTGSADN
ncbi:hypothetical protein M885DRAFT_578927 [Pelagophyceae sp. CCMP2097]|nr:hypothetical protein M885DRAFT_578927 [Pelagophyceae sp. CCMP2097]